MKKKIYFILLCGFLFSATNINAQVVAQGTTGEVQWTLTGSQDNLTLTISGNGAMGDYDVESGRYFDDQSTVRYPSWYWGDYGAIMHVHIDYGVTTIGKEAFFASSLITVNIPNSVMHIGDWAFAESRLTSVFIPSSVRHIGKSAFSSLLRSDGYGMRNFTFIWVSSDNPNYSSIDGVLFNKDKSVLIRYPEGRGGYYRIPDGVYVIGNEAFSHSSFLVNVHIPNSVGSIEDRAFVFCNFSMIIIPESVHTMGNDVFASSFIDAIGLLHKTPPTKVWDLPKESRGYGPSVSGRRMLNGRSISLPIPVCIYVPDKSLEAYRTAVGWRDFPCFLSEYYNIVYRR